MKKFFIILFCLFPLSIFADDPIPQPDGTILYPITEQGGAEVFYAAKIGEIDLSKIDIRNKVIYFVSDNAREFDDFVAHFNSVFTKVIIATDWFREQDFQNRELFNICRALRDRQANTNRLPPMPFMVSVVTNDSYGFLVRWMNDNPLPGRIFFELKNN